MKYLLAIDEGTTALTVMLFDTNLRVVSTASREIAQYYPEKGWVEHDPDEIYRKVLECIGECLGKAGVKGSDVEGLGITNQRETVVSWDLKNGTPFGRAIVWQCRRTADMCEKLKRRGLEREIRKRTGLLIDPYFSATKIKWLLDKNLRGKKNVAFGTVDSWLLYKLTGGEVFATDVSNASRTMLFNIHKVKWDDELLKLFGVKREMLPDVFPSAWIFGKTKGVGVLPDGIPISGIAGDQQSALFGQCCYSVGDSKCTYGTGAFLLVNTGKKLVSSKNRLLTTIAWDTGDGVYYALEGSCFIAGAVVQWLRDGLGLIKSSSEVEKLAESVCDSGGVVFVPAFVGLGAPYWRSDARGIIWGITRDTNAGHIARAALEGIAFQVAELLFAIEKDINVRVKSIKVDGGASSNNLLMQFQADITGKKIIRPLVKETTAMGAVMLAGVGIGMFKVDELSKVWTPEREFYPSMRESERKKRIEQWRRVVTKA